MKWIIAVCLLVALCSSGFAATAASSCSITLTDAQAKMVTDAKGKDVTIDLNQGQIDIVVHNFPKARISSIRINSAHLSGKSVKLQVSSDGTAVSPVRG